MFLNRKKSCNSNQVIKIGEVDIIIKDLIDYSDFLKGERELFFVD